MIKKLEINNVGRFKSSKTEGDQQCLKKNTYIYGKNTFGKSTLTAIFRSLKENKPDYLLGRKTIGSHKQTVKIIPEVTTPLGEYRYTTDESKWSAEFKNLAIFDNHFIRENIYSQNQQIDSNQQKNIETFMLGSKGVEYNLQINSLVEKIRENTTTQTSIKNEYSPNKHVFGGFDFDTFLALTEIVDIDKKIEEEQKELDKIRNAELISSKLKSIKALLEKYKDFDVTNISKKLSVNSELITKHFDTHINPTESKQLYSSFLQTGSKLRTRKDNERCPFCTQEIKDPSAEEFLETIDLIYNENYRNIQESIKAAEVLFLPENFSTKIEEIKADLEQAGYQLGMEFSDINSLLEACEQSISDKKEDLSTELNAVPFADITTKVGDRILTINEEIAKFQDPTEKKAELDSSLKKLQGNKERFSSWKEKCEAYLKAKKDNEELGTQKTTLWDEYMVYASSLSTSMLLDINTILRACNCNFTVQTFHFQGNHRQDLLALSIEGNEISNDGNDSERTIKNCLSDSDKWVLALAFFLASVKNDHTIKLVIMDDPVSSFDSDRKRIILKEIKKVFADTDKQLILLTHQKGFFNLLHKENKGDISSVFLKIDYNTEKGSDLVSCDPDDDPEFMNDYNNWINDMKKAYTSQEISVVRNAHSNIRKVIEHILKTKYPLELTKEYNTMGLMLDRLEEPNEPYSSNSPRAKIDAILANLSHHDQSRSEEYPTSELGIEDYRKDIKDAFDVIKVL